MSCSLILTAHSHGHYPPPIPLSIPLSAYQPLPSSAWSFAHPSQLGLRPSTLPLSPLTISYTPILHILRLKTFKHNFVTYLNTKKKVLYFWESTKVTSTFYWLEIGKCADNGCVQNLEISEVGHKIFYWIYRFPHIIG